MQTQRLKTTLLACAIAGFFAAPFALQAQPVDTGSSHTMNSRSNSDNSINCKMNFELSGWSVFYKTASGNGTVTCDNGRTMNVVLNIKGGGLTAGRYKIKNGHANFSDVQHISDVLGDYAQATAHAGAVGSSHAAVLTNGDVSMALAGTGSGWDIGVGFSGFSIKRASTHSNDTQNHHDRWQNSDNDRNTHSDRNHNHDQWKSHDNNDNGM